MGIRGVNDRLDIMEALLHPEGCQHLELVARQPEGCGDSALCDLTIVVMDDEPNR